MRTHLFCEGVVAVEGVLLVVGLTVVVDDVTLFDNDVTIFDVGEEMMTLRGSFFNFSASISSFLRKICMSVVRCWFFGGLDVLAKTGNGQSRLYAVRKQVMTLVRERVLLW